MITNNNLTVAASSCGAKTICKKMPSGRAKTPPKLA